MGNKLFQRAKEAVYRAETSAHAAFTTEDYKEAQSKINVAKNEISSAFANSSHAEQHQLQELQQRLDSAQSSLTSDNPE